MPSELESAIFDSRRQRHFVASRDALSPVMIFKYRDAYASTTAVFILGIVLLGCRNPSDPPPVDERTCYQTYEFGNSGCLEVTGQVVGANGQPLIDVPVFGRVVPDTGFLVFDVTARTDTAGRFRLRATRMVGPVTPRRDSIRVCVGAMWIPTRARDSVFVTTTVAPVGEIPDALNVRIALPVP